MWLQQGSRLRSTLLSANSANSYRGSPGYLNPLSFSSSNEPKVPTARVGNYTPTKLLGLNKILKMENVLNQTKESISKVWVEHFKLKEHTLCASMDANTYKKIKSRALRCPMFVFPLPKENGHTSIFVQLNPNVAPNEDNCSFTFLDVYKAMGQTAPSYFDTSFYTDFMNNKDLVLMKGQVDHNFMTIQEAQYLTNIWQLYLLDDTKYKMMEAFNLKPETFNFDDVLKDITGSEEAAILKSSQTKEVKKT